MKDILNEWISKFKAILSIIFGIIGAISAIFPITNALPEKTIIRIGILLVIIVIAILSAVICTKIIISRNQKTVYSKGTTKIIFEHADINAIISNAMDTGDEITVIVPVNTNLQRVFDRERIYKHTIHRICLDWIYELKGHDLSYEILKDLPIKKDGFDYNGKQGDWFLLPVESDYEKGRINYLFAEFFELEKKDGKLINSKLEKDQYMNILQIVISAISKLEHESKVYMPLIGAGAGNVEKPKEIMHFMEAIFRFNKSELHQEVHIVIDKRYRKEVPIYQLEDISK